MDHLGKSIVGTSRNGNQALGCDHPGCAAAATHRAPKGREQLNDHHWFCLEHVREYNSQWNFYTGMTNRQVEQEIRNDTVWRRPTWPLGSEKGGAFSPRTSFRDDLGAFEAAASARRQQKQHSKDDTQTPTHIRQALQIMEIEPPVTLTELKSRYKDLVKQLHPDANGGDAKAEDKLKDINQAYATIKKFLAA